MNSFRYITKLINASKNNLVSSQICVIRLSSFEATKFLQQAKLHPQIHVIRCLRTGSTRGPTSDPPPAGDEIPKNEQASSNAPPQFRNLESNAVKKLRVFMLVVVLSTFLVSFLALGKMDKHSDPLISKALEGQKSIELDEFISDILPTGEVQKIIYFPLKQRAIVVLQPGAVINGKPSDHEILPIKIERVTSAQKDQLRLEIRHAEEKLGIPLSEGIPIEIHSGLTFFKGMELAIAFALIAFLFTQYGRLIRRTILKKRAEKEAASKKKP